MTGDSDDTAGDEEILEFPCEFPLKIMGRDEAAFRDAALTIVEAHAGPLPDDAVRSRSSRDGNFIALTVTIVANSRKQLDAIYADLSAHDDILMAL
jgi:putative lipoic acid-binding regulatory protein